MKWYDVKFEPQNIILPLDYPVLKDLSAYTGIDRIYEFILCIHLEQRFLEGLSRDDLVYLYTRDIFKE